MRGSWGQFKAPPRFGSHKFKVNFLPCLRRTLPDPLLRSAASDIKSNGSSRRNNRWDWCAGENPLMKATHKIAVLTTPVYFQNKTCNSNSTFLYIGASNRPAHNKGQSDTRVEINQRPMKAIDHASFFMYPVLLRPTSSRSSALITKSTL